MQVHSTQERPLSGNCLPQGSPVRLFLSQAAVVQLSLDCPSAGSDRCWSAPVSPFRY